MGLFLLDSRGKGGEAVLGSTLCVFPFCSAYAKVLVLGSFFQPRLLLSFGIVILDGNKILNSID